MAIGASAEEQLKRIGLLTQIEDRCGSYTHHYPICIRRVLPDDTLISMTSDGAEPYYALSFISYARPADRQGFLAFAEILSRALGELFRRAATLGQSLPTECGGCSTAISTATAVSRSLPATSIHRPSFETPGSIELCLRSRHKPRRRSGNRSTLHEIAAVRKGSVFTADILSAWRSSW